MAGLSDYAEDKILKHMFTNTPWTPPATLWVSLHTADPFVASEGNTATSEVTIGSNNYARVVGTFTVSTVGGVTSAKNSADIAFPTPSGSWGTVTHIGVMDSQSASTNLLASTPLTTSKTVSAQDQIKFATGDLAFNLD